MEPGPPRVGTPAPVLPSPEVGAIVAGAGSGSRLGRGCKALVRLNGRTLLARALELFLSLDEVGRVVVVGPPGQLDQVHQEVAAFRARRPIQVCEGGATRQQSVRAGLALLEGCEYVLVHDVARPLASPALARRVLAAAQQAGAAIPGLPLRDAIKRVEGHWLIESLDRSRLVLAQTPQGFRYQVLERAHFQAADAGLVGDDDAQLVAAAGHAVAVVAGEPANVKLTTPEDLMVVEALLRDREVPSGGQGAFGEGLREHEQGATAG
ncbi:MAG TPA: 2-C-methyl-D-erythritol 4-phosphate cytidylyltransferase [Candidatus Dormibacteraeota bacterium]|nr:2-C-methyl-D-erythritol 4-phosphate cytidylyltransferase [Candidatus Dormibacteraeota bacterium]